MLSFELFKKPVVTGIHVCKFSANWAVFKDGGKEEKKKDPTTSSVKCYFVRMESYSSADERAFYVLSNKTMFEARSLFMHAHKLASLGKYMARYNTYYFLLEIYVLFWIPSSHLKIDLVQSTNHIRIQVLSYSIEDLYT